MSNLLLQNELAGGVHPLDTINGTADADYIVGTTGDDVIHGLGGDDILEGGNGGNDRIFGDDGRDILYGYYGDDLLHGGDGDDTIDGGHGNDKLFGDAGNDTLRGHESSTDVGASDSIFGGAGDDTINAGSGNNVYNGGAGIDELSFLSLADGGVSVSLAQTSAQNIGLWTVSISGIENLIGTSKDDHLTGSKQANEIYGEVGNDTIEGGGGADTLTGFGKSFGASTDLPDADTFVYASVSDSTARKADLITDLTDADHIDLHTIDANASKGGNQAFHIVSKFTHQAGELVLHYDSGTDQTQIRGDVDGDGRADLLILATGDVSAFTGFVL